jgi:hypothetical protein
MQHSNNPRTRLILGLLFAATLTLAGLRLVSESAWANAALDQTIFLPLVQFDEVPTGTVPLP